MVSKYYVRIDVYSTHLKVHEKEGGGLRVE